MADQPFPKTALALSGGASLGALQVGVLHSLVRAGFRPSMIVGTSVGALNGAYLAFHPAPEDLDTLKAIWLGIKTGDVFPRNPLLIAYRLLTHGSHLFQAAAVDKLVRGFLPQDRFGAAKIPLFITATNLTRGEKVVFDRGRVSDAIRASIAIPGLLPPLVRRGSVYVDGGVVANLDVATAVERGAARVLAIDATGCSALPVQMTLQGLMLRAHSLMSRRQADDEVARFAAAAEIILVCPRMRLAVDPTDFSHTAELIAWGEQIGRRLVRRMTQSAARPEKPIPA
jgi:NTE family protein